MGLALGAGCSGPGWHRMTARIAVVPPAGVIRGCRLAGLLQRGAAARSHGRRRVTGPLHPARPMCRTRGRIRDAPPAASAALSRQRSRVPEGLVATAWAGPTWMSSPGKWSREVTAPGGAGAHRQAWLADGRPRRGATASSRAGSRQRIGPAHRCRCGAGTTRRPHDVKRLRDDVEAASRWDTSPVCAIAGVQVSASIRRGIWSRRPRPHRLACVREAAGREVLHANASTAHPHRVASRSAMRGRKQRRAGPNLVGGTSSPSAPVVRAARSRGDRHRCPNGTDLRMAPAHTPRRWRRGGRSRGTRSALAHHGPCSAARCREFPAPRAAPAPREDSGPTSVRPLAPLTSEGGLRRPKPQAPALRSPLAAHQEAGATAGTVPRRAAARASPAVAVSLYRGLTRGLRAPGWRARPPGHRLLYRGHGISRLRPLQPGLGPASSSPSSRPWKRCSTLRNPDWREQVGEGRREFDPIPNRVLAAC